MIHPRRDPVHPGRDQDLLRLAHGQLPLVRRLATRWHVRRCADCRRRLGQLQRASHALAGAVRDPAMPRWSPPIARVPAAVAFWTLLATTVFLLVVLGTLAVRVHAPDLRPAPSGNCRPGLASDLCR